MRNFKRNIRLLINFYLPYFFSFTSIIAWLNHKKETVTSINIAKLLMSLNKEYLLYNCCYWHYIAIFFVLIFRENIMFSSPMAQNPKSYKRKDKKFYIKWLKTLITLYNISYTFICRIWDFIIFRILSTLRLWKYENTSPISWMISLLLGFLRNSIIFSRMVWFQMNNKFFTVIYLSINYIPQIVPCFEIWL